MKIPALFLFLALTIPATCPAAEVARTREGSRWLISKSLGQDDWLITYDRDRGVVSGSVRSVGGEPTLLDCDVTSFDPQRFFLSCYAAVPSGWEFAAQTSLQRSFLGYPDDPSTVGPTPRPTALPTPRPTNAPCPNISGTYSTSADYTCGTGRGTVSLQQIGCDVSGSISSLNDLVQVTGYLSGRVGRSGEITGAVAISGACFGNLDIAALPDGLGRYIFHFESAVTCTGSASFCNLVAGTLILY